MNKELVVRGENALVPGQIAAGGERARRRFVEFFTANIRNRNTRAAYLRAVSDFFGWCEGLGLAELGALQPVHVAGYVEQLGKTHSAPSVKQHLAAVRMLFDWLVVGQVVATNPASVVRGPKHVVKRGKTPVLVPEEAHQLFESIPTSVEKIRCASLRRSLISVTCRKRVSGAFSRKTRADRATILPICLSSTFMDTSIGCAPAGGSRRSWRRLKWRGKMPMPRTGRICNGQNG